MTNDSAESCFEGLVD